MKKTNSQQRQNIEVSKGLGSRNPLKFRDKSNRKELLTETNSHEGFSYSADIFKYKAVCPYLRQEEDYLPPYCKKPDNCEDIFEYAGIKYCKRELKWNT